MKTLLTILILLASGAMVSAQYKLRYDDIVNSDLPKAIKDTIIKQLNEGWEKKKVPENGMPNAIKVTTEKPVYRGNNGQGFDVYESQLDRMGILMPDSTNQPKMPVLGYQQIQKTIPLSEGITPEMLNRKPWEPQLFVVPKKAKPLPPTY